ncbi:MAG TPA: hypothetical protein VL098_08515 [Flavipsychrobacter sp.]|nr:hypothetical protein [Flavipsychrobacter sp.]
MKKLHLAVTAGLLAALMSCSKGDDKSTPNNPSNVIDAGKLKAKWEMTSFYNLVYNKATNAIIDASGVSQTYHSNGVGQWDASYTTYMTFNNDNTYEQSNADGSDGSLILSMYLPRHGAWQLKNANKAISLEVIPAAGQTDITYDVVEFKDNYVHLIYTDSTTYEDATDVHHLEFKK